jgi:nucleoside-diphosphate-sugar epimerase
MSVFEKSILVTGAGGFIGRRVVHFANANGLNVLSPSRLEIDWTDRLAVASYFAHYRPTAVVHLASPGVFASDQHDPALIAIECSMMENILDAAPDGCRIIGGGSMAEYGQSGRLDERMACSPRNAYARGKFEAGLRLLKRLDRGVISGCHARIFGAFGKGEASGRLFPSLITALSESKLVALSDGQQRRDFVHVNDVARALLGLVTSSHLEQPIINIGTGESVTVRSAVERVVEELGAPRALARFGATNRSPHDQDILEAETFRLFDAIGWVPEQHFSKRAPILPLL